MQLKFTIRDLLWLTLAVGIASGVVAATGDVMRVAILGCALVPFAIWWCGERRAKESRFDYAFRVLLTTFVEAICLAVLSGVVTGVGLLFKPIQINWQ